MKQENVLLAGMYSKPSLLPRSKERLMFYASFHTESAEEEKNKNKYVITRCLKHAIEGVFINVKVMTKLRENKRTGLSEWILLRIRQTRLTSYRHHHHHNYAESRRVSSTINGFTWNSSPKCVRRLSTASVWSFIVQRLLFLCFLNWFVVSAFNCRWSVG